MRQPASFILFTALGAARRAFTVVELVVLLTIAGVLLALAVPRLVRARDAAAVRGAVGELAAMFSLARQTAVVERAPAVVAFDTAAGAVDVHVGARRIAFRALGQEFGIVLRSNRDSTMYDARGIGYGVANVTVIILRGGFVDTLTMSRMGRVRW